MNHGQWKLCPRLTGFRGKFGRFIFDRNLKWKDIKQIKWDR